ncbi:MAG: hypothetical protein BWK77_05905 [Verrucomicrobia bacterium A1]|nr:MAG: hypothetical protein BWK77_05905 [Verrucomicrobia bacterium A1]
MKAPGLFHRVFKRGLTELMANQTLYQALAVLDEDVPPSPRLPSTIPPASWVLENVAVADLTPYTLSQAETKTLTEKLQTTLVRTKYFNVLSRSEMKAVLDAQQFQRSDACDDSTCLVEMGKILAVQKIIGGSVGKVGSTFNLVLRLINVETAQTEITADRELKGDADQLLHLIEDAGRELALQYATTRSKQQAGESAP